MDAKLTQSIANILKKEKVILFAYIFGSSVKKTSSRHNDLDIAIMLKGELRGLEKLAFINRLSSIIGSATKTPADIVILNHAPAALRQQVIKYGHCLFEKQKGAAKEFVVRTITDYIDYLNILNFFYSKSAGRKQKT